uniref:Uncharacterized protein n=1 Tax=Angiostrongylus cantonensis TaxID=6313 RepID=A0A0K0DKH2_ANGCA
MLLPVRIVLQVQEICDYNFFVNRFDLLYCPQGSPIIARFTSIKEIAVISRKFEWQGGQLLFNRPVLTLQPNPHPHQTTSIDLEGETTNRIKDVLALTLLMKTNHLVI